MQPAGGLGVVLFEDVVEEAVQTAGGDGLATERLAQGVKVQVSVCMGGYKISSAASMSSSSMSAAS